MANGGYLPRYMYVSTTSQQNSHIMQCDRVACVQNPLPTVKIGEAAPSLIFTEGRGALYPGYMISIQSYINFEIDVVNDRG